ncbi:MAG: GNAT family N-acetyltransferase [Flavobacteriales bacterium]|nr:GNAT family N-acetyltransferase [Flavobacteriales bacterium]MBP6697903.1 GNAT family N-acetyltransferase [Flavobacteriales bacterium]
MIEHVPHPHLDRARWDAMLRECSNNLWYAQSHVLDAASPGWDALIDHERGAVMPLTHHRKWGIAYLHQPFTIQQLGVFAPDPSPLLTKEFLDHVSRIYRHADIFLAEREMKVVPRGWALTPQQDQLVPTDRTCEEIRATYSTNHRRNLRKVEEAERGFDHDVPLDELIDLLVTSPQFREWGIRPRQEATMRRVMHAARVRGEATSWGVRTDGRLVAVAYFVHFGGRTIFLKGAALAQARATHAMHFLIDRMVAMRAGQDLWLDFAGSNDPDLGRFYAGFGAVPQLYLRATLHRLPGLVRWVLHKKHGR